jgi:uncharacterized protein
MDGYTYPGVYIQELQAAVHTITGVATSIAAFIGWAPQGSTTQPVLVESWSDYMTQFGYFDTRSKLAYAVNQFFGNGGQQAYIVRLAWSDATAASTATTPLGGTLAISANSPGSWGNNLQITATLQKANSTRFSLQVALLQQGVLRVVETFNNLSTTSTDPQYVVTVINNDSQYITITSPPSGPQQPAAPTTAATGGTLAQGTYYYIVAALYAGNQEGFPSNEQSVTTAAGTTNANTVTWTAAGNYAGAAPTGYKIYRGTAPGMENVFYTVGEVLTFEDTGAAGTPGSSSPTINTLQLQGGNDGTILVPADGTGNFENALLNDPNGLGLHLLDSVPIFNLLCVPGETDVATIQALQSYCVGKRAFYIVDCPQTATTTILNSNGPVGTSAGQLQPGITNQATAGNSAYYFPWVQAPDPLYGNRATLFPPCGFVAGIYAATDANRGVWKAPAGIGAGLSAELGLQTVLNDAQNGLLNPQAINCLRHFTVYGDVVWGARTLAGNDEAGSQWKYVPIRRLALYIESSLYDGTQWVVFEPNNERLWGQIRLNVGSFMQGLFLQGAFQGTTPQQAYFVKCDGENNPQSSINQGIVNILVGFLPLYPAEFVVIQIQQIQQT